LKNKIKKNINEQEFFDYFLKSIPKKTKRSVRISLDIASQINFILKQKNISQREFARLLNKKESEISKWLSGNHNFTVNTLATIEVVLGEDIINVPMYAKKELKYILIKTYSRSFSYLEPGQLILSPLDPSQISNANSHYIINYNKDNYETETLH